jgi:hypothetical protein
VQENSRSPSRKLDQPLEFKAADFKRGADGGFLVERGVAETLRGQGARWPTC